MNRQIDKLRRGRRAALKAGGGVGLLGLLAAAGFFQSSEALAQQPWNVVAFTTRSVTDIFRALGASAPVASKSIQITAADIAENGQLVPIEVASSIPKTEMIAILVEKNPNTLSAVFSIPAETDAFVSTRLKMAESSDVVVLVRAEGRNYFARKEIRVTLGGCG
jgi:sulfur-oxidizing protein SoxY